MDTSYTIVNRDSLPYDGGAYEFEGERYQGSEVSFIWVDMNPGGSVRLHKPPYREIFIILEGVAEYTIGSEMINAHAGQIIIVPAETAHKFSNTGDQRLRQIDIHTSRQFVTEWLEE